MEKSAEGSSRAQAAYRWLNYHLLFSPGALFSWGLIVSYNMVEYACVSILVTFYTKDAKRQKQLAEAAILLCLQEGLASFAAIILARLTQERAGRRFYAIVVSISSYITGIMLLWSYARHDPQAMNVPLFVVVSFLFALGKGGADPLLKSFLAQNLSGNHNGTSPSKEETEGAETRNNIWMHSAWILGAIIAIFGFLGIKWVDIFKVSTIVMVAFGLLFLFGCNNSEPIGQWVHKDASATVNDPKQVRNVKCLLILSCIGYSLVLATGNLFFQEQGLKMKSLEIDKEEVRFSLLIVMKTIVNETTTFIFRLCGANKKKGVTLVRIGIGMVSAVICCIVAWKVQIERKKVVKQNDPKTSVVWMFPHYVLLGLVEGLAQSGLEELFENDQTLRNYGRLSKDMVSCIGKFLGIPCILIVRRWFKNFDTDQSHLERYYLMLAIVCSGFLCIYLCVAFMYMKIVPEEEEERSGDKTSSVRDDSTRF